MALVSAVALVSVSVVIWKRLRENDLMKYLGIDFGLRRIGLAISEGNIASPWKVLEVKGFSDALEKTSKIIQDGGFEKIVVGLPEGKMGKNVTGFVNALRKNGIDAETADETLSSKQATEQMIEENIPLQKRRSKDDVAAAIILQNYLER